MGQMNAVMQNGFFYSRSECQSQIHKYPGAKYKKFPTLAEALEFVKGCSGSQTSMGEYFMVNLCEVGLKV